MKATVLALILSVSNSFALASADTDVFTNKVFTSMDVPDHDPSARPCPYNLVIKANPQGVLSFYTNEYNEQNQHLLFKLRPEDLLNPKDTQVQKYFEFHVGNYDGSAYYSTHSSSSEGFYEILIHDFMSPRRMDCRYSIY